jgi:hypothetical protein
MCNAQALSIDQVSSTELISQLSSLTNQKSTPMCSM